MLPPAVEPIFPLVEHVADILRRTFTVLQTLVLVLGAEPIIRVYEHSLGHHAIYPKTSSYAVVETAYISPRESC